MQERDISNLLYRPSPSYRKSKLHLCVNTPRPSPGMAMHWCSSISTPDSQYSRFRRYNKDYGQCRWNQLRPGEKVVYRIIWWRVAECIEILSIVNQTYVACSPQCMRVEIVVEQVEILLIFYDCLRCSLKAKLVDDPSCILRSSLAFCNPRSLSGVIALSGPRLLAPGDNLPLYPQVISSLQWGWKALHSRSESGHPSHDISFTLPNWDIYCKRTSW